MEHLLTKLRDDLASYGIVETQELFYNLPY